MAIIILKKMYKVMNELVEQEQLTHLKIKFIISKTNKFSENNIRNHIFLSHILITPIGY